MPPPPSLTSDERDQLRAQLLTEQARVADQVAGLDRTFRELVDAADLEPPDDEHDPDGTTAYERAQVTSLARIARARLVELERALDAIDEDPSFGACATCGRSIGVARLEAVPGTDRCVSCASR